MVMRHNSKRDWSGTIVPSSFCSHLGPSQTLIAIWQVTQGLQLALACMNLHEFARE
jgi:hypothetical protein